MCYIAEDGLGGEHLEVLTGLEGSGLSGSHILYGVAVLRDVEFGIEIGSAGGGTSSSQEALR